MPSADSLYKEVCVWVVTASGCAVIAIFAVYFVVVVLRLVREMGADHAPASRRKAGTPPSAGSPAALQCGCGGELGPVERVEAGDGAAMEQRTCQACRRVQLVPRAT